MYPTRTSPPAAKHKAYSEHVAERIVAALKERWNADRELRRTFGFVGDRPMFTTLPSDEDQWARWSDPATRRQIIHEIESRYGPEEVPKYVDHMATIDRRLHRGQK